MTVQKFLLYYIINSSKVWHSWDSLLTKVGHPLGTSYTMISCPNVIVWASSLHKVTNSMTLNTSCFDSLY